MSMAFSMGLQRRHAFKERSTLPGAGSVLRSLLAVVVSLSVVMCKQASREAETRSLEEAVVVTVFEPVDGSLYADTHDVRITAVVEGMQVSYPCENG